MTASGTTEDGVDWTFRANGAQDLQPLLLVCKKGEANSEYAKDLLAMLGIDCEVASIRDRGPEALELDGYTPRLVHRSEPLVTLRTYEGLYGIRRFLTRFDFKSRPAALVELDDLLCIGG